MNSVRIQNDIQSYRYANSAYEKLRNQGQHFVKKSKAEKEKLTKMFSDLVSKYYQIFFFDKPKVERPVSPFSPDMKLESDVEIYYKMRHELTAEELNKLPPPSATLENK